MTKTQTPSPQLIEVLNRWVGEKGNLVNQVDFGGYSALVRTQYGNQAMLFRVATLDGRQMMVLTLLAIEQEFVPWLKLMAQTDYTGSGAAQATLKSMGYGA